MRANRFVRNKTCLVYMDSVFNRIHRLTLVEWEVNESEPDRRGEGVASVGCAMG